MVLLPSSHCHCFYSDLRSLDAAHSTHTFKEPARSMGWCRARLCFLSPTDAAVFSKTGPGKSLTLLISCEGSAEWQQKKSSLCTTAVASIRSDYRCYSLNGLCFILWKRKTPFWNEKKKWVDTTDCDRFITIYHGKYVWKKTYRCLYLGIVTPKETIFFCYKNVHTYWSKF